MDNGAGIGQKGALSGSMRTGEAGSTDVKSSGENLVVPSLSLPRGGGAIHGMGEKFSTNPVTGTGSMNVPIFATPGRSGFGPQLSLSYDSGAGNGVFGFGWRLALPAVTRKTDRGIPRYFDRVESDVFILSGGEDLVPAGPLPDRGKYAVTKYRPRTEGLFARIERWTDTETGDTFWRTISKDNITTVYGRTSNSRIADPDDSSRIFSWLICESHDDKGNAITYSYKEEDSDRVDVSRAHEKNRSDRVRSTNRYLQYIRYGNRSPHTCGEDLGARTDWMFELVFDYCKRDLPLDTPLPITIDESQWDAREDPFSSYRPGFEVRTYRLCRRILMFHHFPDELGVQDCLVRSMDFTYDEGPVASFITEIHQSGYVLKEDPVARTRRYTKKSLPPLQFEYSRAELHDAVGIIDPESLRNLPIGLDGLQYQWADLDGEGISGILSSQGDAWYYKPNLGGGRFGEMQAVASVPATADLEGGRQQLMDLAGDGQLDLVEFSGSVSGFYERTLDGNWRPFRSFASLPNLPWNDPNLMYADLNGDGHADILVADGETFTWYPSLAESGFGRSEKVYLPDDEDRGPRLVFADGTQSIHLADLSGDGLSDLVRIRNGEICYWPNLGYGKFGAKVTMDNAPVFDAPDLFDQKRIRLVDTDGSGTTDILYLRYDRVDVYLNQSGNRWSDPQPITQLPPIDDLSSVMAVDLFGSGTGCLVWSSPLPGTPSRQMSYIRLMGEQKPHLLISMRNNMGAETVVTYASSTEFYLADKAAGTPWVTRLPFPVHVVSRVETHDRISRNRFVTRYTYHHGFFDGIEREFRGFGMVKQRDTEEYAALGRSGIFPEALNVDVSSHVPPVLTKTWYHTGAYLQEDAIGLNMAHEYYGAPDPEDHAAFNSYLKTLLPDTVLPENLTPDEEREACRALRGSVLRQEVYAEDGTSKEHLPYSVSERNYAVRCLQRCGDNRHAVFFVYPRETLDCHYERNISDPRISHAMTFEVDDYGNVLKSATIGYGRLNADSDLTTDDQNKQNVTLVTYTENRVTNPIDDPIRYPDDYRTPLPGEMRTFELTGFPKPDTQTWYRFEDFIDLLAGDQVRLRSDISTEYEKQAVYREVPNPSGAWERRLIEHIRTIYRRNNLDGLLPLGSVESLALPGETCKLAFTPGLLSEIYTRTSDSAEGLLPDPAGMLGRDGGHIRSQDYKILNLFPSEDPDDHWWIPSGKIYYCPNSSDNPADEFTFAGSHFFLPFRFQDQFGNSMLVSYDDHLLQLKETCDSLNNKITATNLDYRVMQPSRITDPNGNRSAVAFDALGMVVGTAVMGKAGEQEGDSLDDFDPDPDYAAVLEKYLANPRGDSHSQPPIDQHALLQGATARLVYDFAYHRCLQDPSIPEPRPNVVYTMARETHCQEELKTGIKARIQHSVSYSDGFGREIQRKVQAEPGPAPKRGADGRILVVDGKVEMTECDLSPRWVGSGWTIFNNKGQPVRQFEPFFSDTHEFEFEVKVGVSPIVFYDPVGRVVATLHPDHTYEKVVFDPWRQRSYDVNDTVALDPRDDPDISGYVSAYFERIAPDREDWMPWLRQRIDPSSPPADSPGLEPEKRAAVRALAHADTPTTAYFDTLGRTFLTVARADTTPGGAMTTRVVLDIEGNQREVRDAYDRSVMKCDYDMLGNPIKQQSMDAGTRWMLNDAAGNPIYGWDSLGRTIHHRYDELRRQTHLWVREKLSGTEREYLAELAIYGEMHPDSDHSGASAEQQHLNLRGRIFLMLDGAGIIVNCAKNPHHDSDPSVGGFESYDFKGNLLRSTRRLASDCTQTPDWKDFEAGLKSAIAHLASHSPAELLERSGLLLPGPGSPLESEEFSGSTRYDALNRPIQSIVPHSSNAGTQLNVVQHVYNDANLLECVDLWPGEAAEPTGLLRPDTATRHMVINIDYDAKGRRELVEYGNGVKTCYSYDPLTFRLTDLHTTRESGSIQNIHYAYDPAGNIVHIRDDAQQTVFFSGSIVQPESDYVYDAVYRLISASGREHIGSAVTPWPTSDDRYRTNLPQPGNGSQMRNYTEEYSYDLAGNITRIRHSAMNGGGANQNIWIRNFDYAEPSPIDNSQTNNRLTASSVGRNPATAPSESFRYDAHGNMLHMPHLPYVKWDFKDQLRSAGKSDDPEDCTGCGAGCIVYFTYDAGGQRVRKVMEQDGKRFHERIYIGGFEIFRKYNGNAGPKLERESLHVMDDRQRIAIVDTKTIDTSTPGSGSETLIRYQFGNHLGSAVLELDENADIISYEEYYPYGSTSYQAVRGRRPGSPEVGARRYRYTGKERDEETGLYYHGARYYAPWLGRWVSCDPAGMVDGSNLYIYGRNCPIVYIDAFGEQSDRVQVINFDPVTIVGRPNAVPAEHENTLFIKSDEVDADVYDEPVTPKDSGQEAVPLDDIPVLEQPTFLEEFLEVSDETYHPETKFYQLEERIKDIDQEIEFVSKQRDIYLEIQAQFYGDPAYAESGKIRSRADVREMHKDLSGPGLVYRGWSGSKDSGDETKSPDKKPIDDVKRVDMEEFRFRDQLYQLGIWGRSPEVKAAGHIHERTHKVDQDVPILKALYRFICIGDIGRMLALQTIETELHAHTVQIEYLKSARSAFERELRRK